MATINTIFKQVFGEALKSRGFVKVKGRQPYLVRVVGNEILHVVAFRNEWCPEPGYKDFSIRGGVATVYRKSIDFSCGVRDNSKEPLCIQVEFLGRRITKLALHLHQEGEEQTVALIL